MISGGKDSIYAMYLAMQQGIHVNKIINIIPEKFSFMYHFPNIDIVKYIAESIGIDLYQFKISDNVNELERLLNKFDENIFISGAIESEYQKSRLDLVATYLNKVHYAPLWRKNPFKILEELIDSGFKAKIVSVSAEGLSDNFLGMNIDNYFIEKIKFLNKKYGIHPCGEGGEYESIVLDGPIFNKIIKIKDYEKIIDGSFYILNIKEIEFENKV